MALDINNMSEEDFAKLSEADLIAASTTTTAPVVNEVIDPVEVKNEDQPQGNTEPVIEPADEVIDASNKVEDTSKVAEPKQEAKADKAPEPKVEEQKTEPKPSESVTPETQLAALFAPIKANGRDHKIESIDEIRALVSMGLGFNKKMSELKRAKKIEKILDENEIDEARLSFLIDVSKNNPEAISKLIKESGIDALELDDDKADKYTPTRRDVADEELALDEVLNELKSSPTVNKTINIVTKQWDKASRDALSKNPEDLKVIDSHVGNGVFDLISAQMEIDGALGKLKGLSNIQAYQQVGDALHKAGKFAHIFGSSETSQQAKPAEVVVVQPKLKQAEDDEQRAARRKAASGTPPAVSATKPTTTKSLLDMSPEEFANFKPNFK